MTDKPTPLADITLLFRLTWDGRRWQSPVMYSTVPKFSTYVGDSIWYRWGLRGGFQLYEFDMSEDAMPAWVEGSSGMKNLYLQDPDRAWTTLVDGMNLMRKMEKKVEKFLAKRFGADR